MLTPQVTDVSSLDGGGPCTGLRRGGSPGEDDCVIRTLLEPFWPGRRADAYDQLCR
jgi:hypothetical protein